jgi:hypothetical protein
MKTHNELLGEPSRGSRVLLALVLLTESLLKEERGDIVTDIEWVERRRRSVLW